MTFRFNYLQELPAFFCLLPKVSLCTTHPSLILKYFKNSLVFIGGYGFKNFYKKFLLCIYKHNNFSGGKYQKWIRKKEPGESELAEQKKVRFKHEPKISIATPVFNTTKSMLIDMLQSVICQTYENWELCIADGGSSKPYIRIVLKKYADKDPRIKVKFLDENKGIAGNTNEAISLASGDYIGLLDHDDVLAPFALFESVKAINENPDVDFLYSDEDKISENGKKRSHPFFKPDFSPDILRSCNYISHFLVVKRNLGEAVGWFRDGFEGSQDYDLILRASENARKIEHIPKILYHWRIHSGSAAMDTDNKVYAYRSGEKCLEEQLKRIGLRGSVYRDGNTGCYRTTYELTTEPLVSIIIPSSDQSESLEKCVSSILGKSTYKNFEILLIENHSAEKKTFELYERLKEYKQVRIIDWKEEYNFSRVGNFAAKKAEGSVLLFMNNDTEVITPDWMERLLEHALRKDVGCVGAKLYYPDNSIQHAGVVLGIGGIAGHSHKNFPGFDRGYASRLSIIQNFSAVTAACMMIRKAVFQSSEGFDEKLAFAFNDLDLCLKIRSKGYLIVWTPYAELYHYESKTRGAEDTPEKVRRFNGEIGFMRKKWGSVIEKGDPYYSPNLTLQKEDFGIRV